MRGFNIKNRKTLYFILSIIVVSVFSLTIVYAALSTVLNISGSTQITASNWDIHLENAVVRSGSVSAIAPSISSNNLSFSANLTKPGDFYEFTVDVVNDGSIDAMIDSVVKTPELTTVQAKYLKYEVSYQNGESISTKQTIKSGTSTPIKVRIEYRTDLSASDLPTTTTNLNLKLTLVYVQSDGSGSTIKDNGGVSSIVKVKSGDGTQVGNEVCISNECFYVISSDSTSVTMLTKYNLYVGGKTDGAWTEYGDEATGKQDSEMKGYVSTGTQYKGTAPFSSTNYWSSTVSSYPAYVYDSNSTIYNYVEDYKTYLGTLGVTPSEARLITYEELESLGCSGSGCNEAPSWVYSTSYSSGSAKDSSHIWGILSTNAFDACNYTYVHIMFGVRPVITISRELLDNAGDSTQRLINFTINSINYQAYDGMTWEQFVNSEFNVDNYFGVNNVYGCIHLVWDEEAYDWQETLYYDEFLEYQVSKDDVIIAESAYYGG